MLAIFSCASFARATDFSKTSTNEDGSSVRSVVTVSILCSDACSAAFIAARVAREALVCMVSIVSLIRFLLSAVRNSMKTDAYAPVFPTQVGISVDQAASATDLTCGSSTHASRANQRWLALQCRQYASAKNTG